MVQPKRIALDLRRIKNPGIGRYMKCLVEGLLACEPEHQYLLIMLPGTEEMITTSATHAEKLSIKLKYYSIREQIELPRLLRAHRIDLLHSPHFMLPLRRTCPSIVTIHDVIYLACKEDLPSHVARFYYRTMMAAAARSADRIITDSEFSKQDIMRYLDVESSRIEVIYPAVAADFHKVTDEHRLQQVSARYGIDGRYVLYTGIFKPRKNHAGLLRAFKHLLSIVGDAQLVIAGPANAGEADLRRLAADLGVAAKVVFTGFVEEADLPALYSAAHIYACPSLYEGFGFTVLEAMACGVPVVCSPAASLPEVAGDAALYADSRIPEQFGRALAEAWANHELRNSLIQKGRDNLRRFSWQRTAEQTLAVYRQALGIVYERAVVA
ncbi:MAG TPA: glycosyltransferase family 1 protein [Candidatus Angelobacter sp.]|jgi:glycosyltransferase involved in cell wall biosynthesis|nr:glycosyltransferase family 1 protein [Candidatus Angelobacter sp.]